MVGAKHTVDLDNPDFIILVEVYTVCVLLPLQARANEANQILERVRHECSTWS